MARHQISPERKAVYYLGMILVGIGFLSFFSVFVSGALHFGDFNDFQERGRSAATRAIVGMGMMIVGSVLRGVGRMGAAGSGLALDPERAREDVEPWSRMTGGIVKDTLDEVGISLGGNKTGNSTLPFDEQLRRLHRLREEGIVSEAEYEAKKKQILGNA